MKRYFLMILLVISSLQPNAQTARQKLTGRLTEELTRRGVIVHNNDILGRNKKANQKIIELVEKNFSLNENLLKKSLKNAEPILSTTNDLGRQFYELETPENYSDFVKRDKLLGLANGKLFSIEGPNADRANFRIYYSLNNLLDGAGAIETSAGVKNVIDSRARIAMEYQNKNETQFTAIVGTFDNLLVKAFNRIKQNTIGPQDVQLFTNLWSLYCNGTLSTDKDYHIIARVDALIISISDNNKFGKKIEFDGAMSTSIAVPWARAAAEGELAWSKATDSNINSNAFEIYFLEAPVMYKIPTYSQLITAWNTVSINNTEKYFVQPSNLFFQNNNKLSTKVKFGPFSDPDLINSITIDLKQFNESQKGKLLVKNPTITKREIQSQNTLVLDVSFEPNSDWINDQINSVSVSNEVQLVVQYAGPGEEFNLKRVYPLSFSASVMARQKPLGRIDDPVIAANGSYTWSFNVSFDNLPNLVSPENLYDGNMIFTDSRLSQILNSVGATPTVEVFKENQNSSIFKVKVQIAVPSEKLSQEDKFLRCVLPILIKYDGRQATNKTPSYLHSLKRQLEVTLPGLQPAAKQDIQTSKRFTTPEEVLESLREDVMVNGLNKSEFKLKLQSATAEERKVYLKGMLEQLGIPMKDETYLVPLFLIANK